MTYSDEVKERARALRSQGLSVAQIASSLGGLPTSTVQKWVVGVPPPVWTRRPRAKDDQRTEARALRAQGMAYDEIASRLGVSKSSVSLWVRDLPRPNAAEPSYAARDAAARRYFEERRRRVDLERQRERLAWSSRLGRLTDRELLIAGAVAYWAEGKKAKPWRRSVQVTFVNSDPDLIRLWLSYLALVGIGAQQLRFRVQIHESADLDDAARHWSGVVGIPVEQLQRPTLKRHRPRTNRRNVGSGYYGCLTVTVLRSADLYLRLEGTWWAVRASASRRLLEGASRSAEDAGTRDAVLELPPRLRTLRNLLRPDGMRVGRGSP